ncbi:MAG: HAMP domain-containing histidine kinase, partial [Bdellovibrionales bacterium]|nr:HAMP domain-containing histidine kinase [Bdellovibrionales bacterium]
FSITIPATIYVILKSKISIPYSLQITHFLFYYCILIIAISIKNYLIFALEKAWQEARSKTEQLKESYKTNLQVAHDLRSPIGALNAISHKLESEDPTLQKVLNNSIERINAISDHLLLEHKQKLDDLEKDFFDLEAELDSVVAEKKVEFANIPNLNIRIEMNEPLIRPLSIPRDEFHRVISNLVNNSVEALENRESKQILVRVMPQSSFLILEIEDNGCGISKDQVSQIFKENFTTKDQGTGIGLSYCQATVRSWGGSLKLKSSSSKGTLFEARVPYAKK